MQAVGEGIFVGFVWEGRLPLRRIVMRWKTGNSIVDVGKPRRNISVLEHPRAPLYHALKHVLDANNRGLKSGTVGRILTSSGPIF